MVLPFAWLSPFLLSTSLDIPWHYRPSPAAPIHRELLARPITGGGNGVRGDRALTHDMLVG